MNNHISETEYAQLPDSEKAGYKPDNQWRHLHCDWRSYSEYQPDGIAIKVGIIERLVYIPIHPTPDREPEEKNNGWIKVSDVMPPFDTHLLLRGIITWRSKNSVSYFSDVVKNDYEILEYGNSGYLLETNNDYLVVNHPNPEEICSEYITHWRPIVEPLTP